MRLLATARKPVSALVCATFLVAVPAMVRGPQPPSVKGLESCKLVLGDGAPIKPHPHECWHALASWYGPGFEGQLTADGSIFNMYAATAAQRSLPLGSVVRVSNPSTGRSMIVTINDRGPYVPGRGLDVSYEVARMLGFAQKGLCRVEIEVLKLPQKRLWLSASAKN